MDYFYDHETDSLSIMVGDFSRYYRSEEIAPGVILHLDPRRQLLGVEIRKAKTLVGVSGLQSFEPHAITTDELSRRMVGSEGGRVVLRALQAAA